MQPTKKHSNNSSSNSSMMSNQSIFLILRYKHSLQWTSFPIKFLEHQILAKFAWLGPLSIGYVYQVFSFIHSFDVICHYGWYLESVVFLSLLRVCHKWRIGSSLMSKMILFDPKRTIFIWSGPKIQCQEGHFADTRVLEDSIIIDIIDIIILFVPKEDILKVVCSYESILEVYQK